MASLSGWTEGILFSILIVILFGSIVGSMNYMYGKNNEVGLGTNTTSDNFADYQGSLATQTEGGEVQFTTDGLSLKSSWNIIKSIVTTIWNFITGGWIETIVVQYMQLPSVVAVTFRMLYFLSIGFIILKILFKVRP
jgi:hypothetical protein